MTHFERRLGPLPSKKAEMLSEVRESHANCLAEIDASDTTLASAEASIQTETALADMDATASETEARMEECAVLQVHRYRDYRTFQYQHGLQRPAMMPDPLLTIFLAVLLGLAEGMAAGALMVSDGKMGLVEGLTYGIAFATVAMATGLFAGYLPGRYLTYMANAPELVRGRWKVRSFAWVGFIGLISLLALLVFSAARTRVLGTHEGVFDFSEVGFWETFNNSLSLAIVTLGLLGSMVAVWKGRTGFSDPVPGYTLARREAETGVRDTAGDIAADAKDSVEGIFEAALDVLDELEDRTEAVGDTLKRIRRHNVLVDQNRDAYRAYAAQRAEAQAFIDQQLSSPLPPDDLEAFDALRIDASALVVAGNVGLGPQMGRLRATRDRALARIRTAHGTFRAQSTTFTTTMNKGGTHG